MLAKWFRVGRVPSSLVDEVIGIVNLFTGQPVNRETLTTMQQRIDGFFESLPGQWMLFEGLRVTGAQLQLIDGVVSFHWRTTFFPSQRYSNQYGKAHPLGYYGHYDLWVIKQGSIPPVVLARFGSAVSDYECVIATVGTDVMSEELTEAYRRAEALGVFGTEIPEDPHFTSH